MGCNCGERRNQAAQAIKNIRKGDVQAARQNVQRFNQTIRTDLRNLRSALTQRPPSRVR